MKKQNKITLCIAGFALSICPLAIAQSKSSAHVENHTRYLLERVRAVTDSGIVGMPAGTEVEVLATKPDGMSVKTKDGITFNVSAEKLTPDQALARANQEKAEQAEAEAKAKRDALVASQRAKILEHQQKVASAMQSMAEMSAASSAVPAATPPPIALGGSALDQPAQRVNWVIKRPSKDKDKDKQDRR